jgi:hypothetical protein
MNHATRAVLRHLIASAVAVMVLAPAVIRAQGQSFGRATMTVEERYDSNLFGASQKAVVPPQSDWITLFGPLLETGYDSTTLRLEGHYGFRAEKYRTLTELDKLFARQDGGGTLAYQGRRLSANVRGGYLYTQNPTDLNVETLRILGRSPAQRVDSAEALVVKLSPVTNLKLDHVFNRDTLEGASTSNTNALHAGVEHQTSGRTSLRADYRAGLVSFSNVVNLSDAVDFTSDGEERFHVGTVGVAHAFTPAFNVEIDGGVRTTSGDLDPEITAIMRHRLEHGAIALRYERTRSTTIGEAASMQIQGVGAQVSYAPTRAFALTVAPTRTASGGTLSRDVVYFLDITTRIRVARRWSILGAGRTGRQDRSFPIHDTVNLRSISLSTSVTLGTLEREREEPESENP